MLVGGGACTGISRQADNSLEATLADLLGRSVALDLRVGRGVIIEVGRPGDRLGGRGVRAGFGALPTGKVVAKDTLEPDGGAHQDAVLSAGSSTFAVGSTRGTATGEDSILSLLRLIANSSALDSVFRESAKSFVAHMLHRQNLGEKVNIIQDVRMTAEILMTDLNDTKKSLKLLPVILK